MIELFLIEVLLVEMSLIELSLMGTMLIDLLRMKPALVTGKLAVIVGLQIA